MCLCRRRGLNRNPVRASVSCDTLKGDCLSKTMSNQTQSVPTKTIAKISDNLFAKLRTVSILSSLNDEQLRCLEGAEEIHLQKDDLLVRQGEVAHYLWILLEGEFRLLQTLPDGREVALTPVKAGNAFGEVPLLSNTP